MKFLSELAAQIINRSAGPMSTAERVFTIGIGVAGIIWCLIPGVTFYPGLKGGPNRQPMPRWLGRVWFIALGLWFIYMGLRYQVLPNLLALVVNRSRFLSQPKVENLDG